MIKNRLPLFLATVAVCVPALAENATPKPLSENDLLRQIESITPSKSAPSVLPVNPAALPVNPPGGAVVKQNSWVR